MKQIAAAKFEEQCLSFLDRVDPDGIVITKHGKPMAKLIPFTSDSASLIGSLRHKRGTGRCSNRRSSRSRVEACPAVERKNVGRPREVCP
jgi:prevent-host-death family protein